MAFKNTGLDRAAVVSILAARLLGCLQSRVTTRRSQEARRFAMTTPFKWGDEFLINTTTTNGQTDPAITALADGRFVAAWTDQSATGGDDWGQAVRAQIFNADGSMSGAEFLVNTITTGDQSDPAITALANGRFVVTWMDYSLSAGDLSGDSVRAQIFNADGSKSGS